MLGTGTDVRTQEVFLEGLKRYRERGIRILIDGKETDESKWKKIFEPRFHGDTSFYMADFVFEDEPLPETGRQREPGQVREPQAAYGRRTAGMAGMRLKEIRLDRVYNR